MAGTFYGFEIVKSGLYASQRAIELTGHNIANAETPGYTRQKLSLSSVQGQHVAGIILSGNKAQIGGGVSIDYINQVRNEFLDSQYRTENSTLADWGVKADVFYYVEDIFNEPSDTGIASVLNTLNDSFQELAKNPSSEDIRNLVKQNAISLAETMNYYSTKLTDLQKSQDDAIEVSVGEVNNLITQIQELNVQILKYQMNGSRANDLKDKQNLAMDKLSALIDISYSHDENDQVSIYFGKDKTTDANKDDYCLLDGTANIQYSMEVTKDKNDYYGNADSFHTISITSKNGSTVEITGNNLMGGQIKGYLDARDGDSSTNMGLPYVLEQLDKLAQGLVTAYNEVNNAGYGIPYTKDDGTTQESQTGVNFFDPTKVTAKDMSLSAEILESVFNIAASDTKVDMSNASTQEGNNGNAVAFTKISEKTDIPIIGNVHNFLKSIISDVGVRADQCNQMYDNQEIIMLSATSQRSAVSDVSIDEEVANLLSYEKSYAAASRVLNALDEMLDILINKTGMVGR